MGLFLTLLYILTAYLGPQTVFGSIAEYRVEFIIAFLALVASIPSIQTAGISRLAQTYALAGMCVAVFISFVVNGLAGLAPTALFDFVPNAFTFFLIVVNCKKKRHLQMVVLVLLFACLFTIYQGYTALRAGNVLSPYLMGMGNDEGEAFYRLRGVSFVNDPNDLAQLIVSLIPCLFFFWRPGSSARNTLFVLVPTVLLLFGMYLTHSRGGIIALLAIVVVAGRRKIGTIPSVIIAGLLFAVSMAVGWSGGRGVSVEAGADRMEAWSVGLGLIKSHPLFGVGFQRFVEYFYITAHNSIVVCAAELGMFGLFFWVMFVTTTVQNSVIASAVVKSKEQLALEEEEKTPLELSLDARTAAAALTERQPDDSALTTGSHRADDAATGHPMAANPYFAEEEVAALPEQDIRRLARLLVISLSGYLVAGWFLSRAYVMTLFIYGGMVEVVYQMALNQGLVSPRLPFPRVMRLSAIISVGLIIVVYIMLRVQHLTHS